MGDMSDETRELCRREGMVKISYFSFYKDKEKVHKEEGIGPDELIGDALYYDDHHSVVVQLHSRADVDGGESGKLVVLDVGLKHRGLCVKVYPTMVKLSRSMADMVVFARMNGDENESFMEFLKDMEVVQVPMFMFIRDGQIAGRYVGSDAIPPGEEGGLCLLGTEEPLTFEKAKHEMCWRHAMEEEITSIEDNGT